MAFKFEVGEGKCNMIVGYKGDLPEKVVIPEKINGKVITEIAEHLFMRKLEMKSIFIPKTIKLLKYEQFYGCLKLPRLKRWGS